MPSWSEFHAKLHLMFSWFSDLFWDFGYLFNATSHRLVLTDITAKLNFPYRKRFHLFFEIFEFRLASLAILILCLSYYLYELLKCWLIISNGSSKTLIFFFKPLWNNSELFIVNFFSMNWLLALWWNRRKRLRNIEKTHLNNTGLHLFKKYSARGSKITSQDYSFFYFKKRVKFFDDAQWRCFSRSTKKIGKKLAATVKMYDNLRDCLPTRWQQI